MEVEAKELEAVDVQEGASYEWHAAMPVSTDESWEPVTGASETHRSSHSMMVTVLYSSSTRSTRFESIFVLLNMNSSCFAPRYLYLCKPVSAVHDIMFTDGQT